MLPEPESESEDSEELDILSDDSEMESLVEPQ